MDYDIVAFWIVSLSSLVGLVVAWIRMRGEGRGWIVLYSAILLLSVTGWLMERPALIYTATAAWVLLVLIPGLIGRRCNRHVLQQEYSAAHRLARILAWLHPADGYRDQPKIIYALELAQQGDFASASEILERFRNVESFAGMAATANLYRLTNQWEELLVWYARHFREIERYSQFLPLALRARGETGDLRGLVEFYDAHRLQIGKLLPVTSRDTCRLMLFAFCGKRQAVGSLYAGSLAILPATARNFWLATADSAAGQLESAKRQWEELLPVADPPMRRTIERRLSRLLILPEPPDASVERVLEEATLEHSHEDRFGARRSLLSNRARATQILILINVIMFAVEIASGGGADTDVLYRLGALFPPAVQAGEWWRLITSLFLHFGMLHLAMNMFALCLLGPFMEFALGFRRFILIYLLAGIGSMQTVMIFSSGPDGPHLTVGASGCIMGLVGGTGALMLRAWLQEKATAAKRRLLAIVLIVSLQTLFDSMVPQVSMTAHLSGALIGFAVTLVLRDRLKLPMPQQISEKS